MENAEVSRWTFEYFYGVELFLETFEGKRVLNSLSGDVEKQTFIMLLEWTVPEPFGLNDAEKHAFTSWKNTHNYKAWTNYIAGRFMRDDLFDQNAFELDFETLRETARGYRSDVLRIIKEYSEPEECGRETPLIPVNPNDLDKCLPSERLTFRCPADPEVLQKLRDYIVDESMREPIDISEFFDASERRVTIPPPPAVHPINPCMQALSFPESIAPRVTTSKPQAAEEGDMHLEISFSELSDDKTT